jgi:hypothetical protein
LELDNKLPNPGITIAVLTEAKPLQSTVPAQQAVEKKQNHDAAKKWMEWSLDPRNAPDIKDPEAKKSHLLQTVLMAGNWGLSTGEIDFALAQADKATQQDPKNIDAKLLRGLVARFKKDLTTAEKQFQGAFDQSPGHFGASNQLAQVLAEGRDADKKRRGLDLATVNARQYSKNPEAIATYIWALYQLDRKQEAAGALSSILQGGNISSDTAYIAAMVLKDSNQANLAIQLLEAAGNNKEPFIHRDEAAALLIDLKKKAPTTTTP